MERKENIAPDSNDWNGLAEMLAERFSQHIENNPDAQSWEVYWEPDGENQRQVFVLAREILEEMYLHIDFDVTDNGPRSRLQAKRIPL